MAEMNEASIYEALGVTPKGEGEQAQGTADPAAAEPETAGEGAKEQEPAEPAPEGKEPAAEETGEEPGQQGAKEPLTEAQRRENAAQRRRQEQEAAIAQAVKAALEEERARAKSEWDAFFKKANLKNTITGAPITTQEEFSKWEADYSAARLERDLKAGRLTPEALDEAIRKNPTIVKMQESQERKEAEAEKAASAETKAKIEAEIAEIHKLDPSISTMEDLLKMPNAKAFYEYVQRGNTFLDAYRLVNREKLEAQIAEAARQQAMSAARSKDHMTATGAARGAGAASVPADEMEMFRLFNPNASEAEIQAYYNKSKKT